MPRKRIEYILDHATVEAWEDAFTHLAFNRFEGQALRGFFEEMDHLIDRRDDVDILRAEFETDASTGRQRPNATQQRRLYSHTKAYFDTYYSSLSHLSSVVGRFSKVFGGVAHTDNKSFLKWAKTYCASFPSNVNAGALAFTELEAARLFRALLNHPQQFSPPDWSTETRPGYEIVHIVMHGAQSRSGKIPPGSTRQGIPSFIDADWRMGAPDEVSVTNCLANASAPVLSTILAHRRPDAAFLRRDSRLDAALETVITGGRQISPGTNVTTAQTLQPQNKDKQVIRN